MLLKREKGYEFECNVSPEMEKEDDFWGAEYIFFGNIGVEYNYCIEDGENYCAIYKMELDEEKGVWNTDGSTFVHYEIDFAHKNWVEEFEIAMCNALIRFFNL